MLSMLPGQCALLSCTSQDLILTHSSKDGSKVWVVIVSGVPCVQLPVMEAWRVAHAARFPPRSGPCSQGSTGEPRGSCLRQLGLADLWPWT